jgi:hypothetical protein
LPENMAPLLKLPRKMLAQASHDVSWEMRPKAVVEVDLDTTLQEILQRAARRLKIKVARDVRRWRPKVLYLVAFHAHGHGRAAELELVIDARGRITANFFAPNVTYRQVVATSEAGLLDGDPDKIYLLVNDLQGIGGNGYFFWEDFVRLLPDVLIYMGGVYGGVRLFIDVAQAGLKAIRRARASWSRRRLHLTDLQKVTAKPRTSREAARLLGISKTRTERVLRALALEPAKDGRWRSRTDPDADPLRLALEVAAQAAELHLDSAAVRHCLELICQLPEKDRRRRAGEILQRAHEEMYPDVGDDNEDTTPVG